MWQKTIAGILIMLGAQGFGLALCQNMNNLKYHMQQQKQLVRYIIEEINYIQRPISEILEEHSKRLGNPYQSFAREVACHMNHVQGQSLYQIWESEIENSIKNGCYFPAQALETLREIGKNLGCQEERLQVAMLQMLEMELEEKLNRQKKEKEEKGKLIQTLSLLTGVFCIVIFL